MRLLGTLCLLLKAAVRENKVLARVNILARRWLESRDAFTRTAATAVTIAGVSFITTFRAGALMPTPAAVPSSPC